MDQAGGMMLEIGRDVIEQKVMELACTARGRLRELGAEATETGSQIVAAKFPGIDPSHLARELKKHNVNVAARHGFLRVSPHFYNNLDDLERVCEAIKPLI